MDDEIDSVLQKLTLEEKASLCSGGGFFSLKGIGRLGIESASMFDGPHGLRKQADGEDNLGIHASKRATCFPTEATVACSWDPGLLREIGRALAEECLAEDVAVLLGPGVNIKRSPLCGRNFEYYSEDPYLAGELASAFIDGVQSKGVGASVKHFAANNVERLRATIDVALDERRIDRGLHPLR